METEDFPEDFQLLRALKPLLDLKTKTKTKIFPIRICSGCTHGDHLCSLWSRMKGVWLLLDRSYRLYRRL